MRITLAWCLVALTACGDDGLKQLDNRAPNAVISCPSPVAVGEAVNCTAMASSDPDVDARRRDHPRGGRRVRAETGGAVTNRAAQ